MRQIIGVRVFCKMKLERSVARHLRLLFVALPSALALSGCMSHTWTPGPGMSLADFEPAKARCSLMARNNGGGFVAYGTRSEVAGAALGHAIGETIRAQANFNDCLAAGGWRIQTSESIASNKMKSDNLKAVAAALKDCVLAVRNEQRFTTLQQYLTDNTTGKYTVMQLTVDRLATKEEAATLASYIDSTESCRSTAITGYERTSPTFAGLIKTSHTQRMHRTLAIIKRQSTWSEGAIHHNDITEALEARLKTFQL